MNRIILTTLTILAISLVTQAQYADQTNTFSSFDSNEITKDKLHQIMFAEKDYDNELNEVDSGRGAKITNVGLAVASVGLLLIYSGFKTKSNFDGLGLLLIGGVVAPIGGIIVSIGLDRSVKEERRLNMGYHFLHNSNTIPEGCKREITLSLGSTTNGLGLIMTF